MFADKQAKRFRFGRFFLKLLIAPVLILALVLLVFRFIPLPTSAFIYQQNSLARAQPKVYKPANYHWVDLAEMSSALPLAAISAEDQRFFDHYGFDLTEIKAALDNHNKGQKLRGASSITQQLVKNMFLWSGRSTIRKGLEAIIVPFVELLWPKRRILEVYLNIVQFGPATYGVHQASLKYFTKLPKHITQREAAWLLAVLPSPGKSKIHKPSVRLQKRQQWIYKQMKVLHALEVLKKMGSP